VKLLADLVLFAIGVWSLVYVFREIVRLFLHWES
jgi:hypothetical protein